MSTIYSTFSNPSGDLGALQSEFEGLFNFFNKPEIKHKVDFRFSLNPTVSQITSDLIAGQKKIRLFHFSGHSNGSGMNFSGSDFNTEHVREFFNTINERGGKNQLECVFINGCENEEIVKHLSQVPVIIGTKSKIQDAYAKKFSLDFFSALIEAENSYEEAFNIASSAQPGLETSMHVRGEDGAGSTTDVKLNDYFVWSGAQSDLRRKFPFRREINWTKNLVFLFILIAAVVAYLFKDPIIRMFRGYSCDPIATINDKCNFVIADFSYPPSEIDNFNRWLFHNVSTAETIREYLNPINIESFGKVIHNNSVNRDSMPRLCGYDFNLTGSFTRNGNRYLAEFNIYPYDLLRPGAPGVFAYHVSSLSSLDTLITYQTADEANQFVLFEMCAACAEQRDNVAIARVMSNMLKDYPDTLKQTESFQLLNLRLSEVALEVQDTSLALESLSKATKVANNDLVLSALEKIIGIHENRREVEKAYTVISDYLTQLELRLDTSVAIIRNKTPREYQKAASGVRLQRANMVVKYPRLKDKFKAEAIRDYEVLDKTDPGPSKYDREIRILKKEVAVSSEFTSPPTRDIGDLRNPVVELSSDDIFVVAIGYKIRSDRYEKMLSALKRAEYRIDGSSSLLSDKPLENRSKPVVIFHHESLKDEASTLAKQLRSWMDVSFEIEYRDPASSSPSPALGMMLIYWPG